VVTGPRKNIKGGKLVCGQLKANIQNLSKKDMQKITVKTREENTLQKKQGGRKGLE